MFVCVCGGGGGLVLAKAPTRGNHGCLGGIAQQPYFACICVNSIIGCNTSKLSIDQTKPWHTTEEWKSYVACRASGIWAVDSQQCHSFVISNQWGFVVYTMALAPQHQPYYFASHNGRKQISCAPELS